MSHIGTSDSGETSVRSSGFGRRSLVEREAADVSRKVRGVTGLLMYGRGLALQQHSMELIMLGLGKE
jgi:hypothetical protein